MPFKGIIKKTQKFPISFLSLAIKKIKSEGNTIY